MAVSIPKKKSSRLGAKAILRATLLLAFLGFVLFGVSNVHAAPAQGGGVTVTPAQLVFTLGGQTSVQVTELAITNNYNSDLRLTAELNDIDQASVNLLPTGPLKNAPLSAAISLSATDITVPAYGVYKLKVQVTNTEALPSGGHYASLVLTQQLSLTEAQAYRSALAVSLFVVKAQGIKADLQLLGTETNRWLFSLPTEAKLLFRNEGNVHVVPRASVSVYTATASQRLLGQGIINQDSRVLFPGQERAYSAPITRLERLWVPQKVQMVVAYRVQGDGAQQESKQVFWYIPPVYLVVPLLPILVAVGLLGYKYRVGIGRNVRRFAVWVRVATGRFVAHATPVAKRAASTTKLALKRYLHDFSAFMTKRRTAYFAWRLKRAEEQAAIQAAKDAVRGKPIDLWANAEFAEPAISEEVADLRAVLEDEPIGTVAPLEDTRPPVLPSVVVTPDKHTPEAPPVESPNPPDSLAEPLLEGEELAVLRAGMDSTELSHPTLEPETPATAEAATRVSEPSRPEPKSVAKLPPEPQAVPEPAVEPAKPPELPKYKPVDYPGLRKLGLAPSNAPKPIPAKRPAATTPGVSRVPQLVKSTKTTLPKPTRKRASGATKSAAQAAKKSSAKTAKTSAVKKPKNASPRTKSSGRTQS